MAPHVSEAQKAINDEVLTVVMLESPEAIKNADDIASVDGIDVLLIGSFDLTSELGIPGQMGHQKLIDACQAVGDACRKHGKALGVGGINEDEDARRYIGMGSRFITSGNDHSFIVSGSIERAKFFRGVAAEVGGQERREEEREGLAVAEFRLPAGGTFGQQAEQVPQRAEVVIWLEAGIGDAQDAVGVAAEH